MAKVPAATVPPDSHPVLGVVLLDLPHYAGRSGAFTPAEEVGLGNLPRGFFECPATWPLPTAYEVAEGADIAATLSGAEVAKRGVATAVQRLAGECDLVIGDCGFFWVARERVRGTTGSVILSGLDLLPLAASLTRRPIGVLTFSVDALGPMLAGSPFAHRLRVLGLAAEPTWSRLAVDDYGTDEGWTRDALETELLDRVATEVREGGLLHGVGALVLECTVMPQFAAALSTLTRLPILDLATLATGLLAPGTSIGTDGGKRTINPKEIVS